jgi:hypothetical protein
LGIAETTGEVVTVHEGFPWKAPSGIRVSENFTRGRNGWNK